MLIRDAQAQKLAKDPANRLPILFYSFHLPTGIQTSLGSQLQAIQTDLESATTTLIQRDRSNANTTSACKILQALINHVQALSGKLLTPEQANQLITAVRQVQGVLGC